MSAGKQLRFEDLQPHVDMLCDALENKGASSSGIPNEAVYHCAQKYRDLLALVRYNRIDYGTMSHDLYILQEYTLDLAKNNQLYRVTKIVNALDIFIRKEYNKYTN